VIVSASGMLSGGRVLHHLKRLAPDPKNLLLLVGYQAAGTRGRRLLEGEETIKVHGQQVPVRARALTLHGLSGHADAGELLRWIDSAPAPPRVAFVVHGEPRSADALAGRLRRRYRSTTLTPALGDEYDLLELLE
jgi:metallo-beta-lactamase family protein